MSKLAQGQQGGDLGSASYFEALNSGYLISDFLPSRSGCDYFAALGDLAGQATDAIRVIYEDLQTHQHVLRYLSSERRSRLSSLVTALADLCSTVSPDTGLARECGSMLSLFGFSSMPRSMATDSEIQRGAEIIRTGGSSGLDAFSREATMREAAQWGESFAVGADELKRNFLQQVGQRQSQDFLKDVWDAYHFQKNPGEYCGANGCEFCSDSYIAQIEGRIFPRSATSAYIQVDYAARIREDLNDIAQQIQSDVSAAHSSNDYLTEYLGEQLCQAASSLERCGVMGGVGLQRDIQSLCWFTPISPPLVGSLNRLGWAFSLTEDGVYGEKTSQAVHQFYDKLKSGQFPALQILEIGSDLSNLAGSMQASGDIWGRLYKGANGPVRARILGMQRPRGALSYKISGNGTRMRMPPTKSGYIQVSKSTYDFLQKFQGVAKVAKVAGRVLLFADAALETAELVVELEDAMNQADDKIAAATGRAIGGFLGNAGGLAVVYLGGGAIIGAAAAVSAPALVIAGVGVFVAGGFVVDGAEIAGEWLGELVGGTGESDILDITDIMSGR